MIIVDTNIILRYLLGDNEELCSKAVEIIDNNDVFIPTEVIVEACYVLRKVYEVEKEKIFEVVDLLLNMENVRFQNKKTVEIAFELYVKHNLDIVDCFLVAYSINEKYNIKTFDKKLNNVIMKYNK